MKFVDQLMAVITKNRKILSSIYFRIEIDVVHVVCNVGMFAHDATKRKDPKYIRAKKTEDFSLMISAHREKIK